MNPIDLVGLWFDFGLDRNETVWFVNEFRNKMDLNR